MFQCWWLALLALIPMTLGIDPGVKVRVTEKALDYGKYNCSSFFKRNVKVSNSFV